MDDGVSVSSTVVKKPFMPLMRNVCGLDVVDEKWGETLVEADVEGTILETDATNQSKWRNQSMSNLRKVHLKRDHENATVAPLPNNTYMAEAHHIESNVVKEAGGSDNSTTPNQPQPQLSQNTSLSPISSAVSSEMKSNTATIATPQPTPLSVNTTLPPPPLINSTSIDIVSLTVKSDFFILFNKTAITSWIAYIQNIRSITFIGPPDDYSLFKQNMHIHYPHLIGDESVIPVRWVNETHWMSGYKKKYRCPYPSACQQLMKLHVFDVRTKLGMQDIGNNVLILDSDTVWSRNVTFVHPNNTVNYFEIYGMYENSTECTGRDPVRFTEAITVGFDGIDANKNATKTPYTACRRPEYPEATGARHIAHHMLFQYDVMMDLHDTIQKAWGVETVWQAATKCYQFDFCRSRVAEYELYHAFVSENYPERMHSETLIEGVNFMGASAVCDAEEIECCREMGVVLKGCHNHRIREYNRDPTQTGSICCEMKRRRLNAQNY